MEKKEARKKKTNTLPFNPLPPSLSNKKTIILALLSERRVVKRGLKSNMFY